MISAIVAYWIGAAFDGWTTERALDRARKVGGVKEGNPIVRWFIDKMGDRGLLVIKLIGFLLLLWVGEPGVLWFAAIVQFAAGVWNLNVLLKLKRRSR